MILEGRVLHKGAWVAILRVVQDYKKVKSPGRNNLSLAVKGIKYCAFFMFANEKVFQVFSAIVTTILFHSDINSKRMSN